MSKGTVGGGRWKSKQERHMSKSANRPDDLSPVKNVWWKLKTPTFRADQGTAVRHAVRVVNKTVQASANSNCCFRLKVAACL